MSTDQPELPESVVEAMRSWKNSVVDGASLKRIESDREELEAAILAYGTAQRQAGERDAIGRALQVVRAKLTNQDVQQCCICYGGSSFPGPMANALECDRSILASRIEALLPAPNQEAKPA